MNDLVTLAGGVALLLGACFLEPIAAIPTAAIGIFTLAFAGFSLWRRGQVLDSPWNPWRWPLLRFIKPVELKIRRSGIGWVSRPGVFGAVGLQCEFIVHAPRPLTNVAVVFRGGNGQVLPGHIGLDGSVMETTEVRPGRRYQAFTAQFPVEPRPAARDFADALSGFTVTVSSNEHIVTEEMPAWRMNKLVAADEAIEAERWR